MSRSERKSKRPDPSARPYNPPFVISPVLERRNKAREEAKAERRMNPYKHI